MLAINLVLSLLASDATFPLPDLTSIPPPVTSAGLAVQAAYDRVEATQSKLPSPRSDRERLLRLQQLDEAGREVLVTIDLSHLPGAERTAGMNEMGRQIARQDQIDQEKLLKLMPKSGWFPLSVYGEDGPLAAWLIVQHATNNPGLMRATVRHLDELRRTREAKPTAYAIMYDRVALMFYHKGQRYGNQLECHDGQQRPQRVQDPVHLNERRKAIGFKQTEAAYMASMEDGYCRRNR